MPTLELYFIRWMVTRGISSYRPRKPDVPVLQYHHQCRGWRQYPILTEQHQPCINPPLELSNFLHSLMKLQCFVYMMASFPKAHRLRVTLWSLGNTFKDF